MVKIRLTKTGARNTPSYRIVAVDSKRPRNSRALENLGFFNPSHHPIIFKVDKKRVKYWQGVGAQTSVAVGKLLAGKYKYIKYTGSSKQEKEETSKKEIPPQSS